MINTAREKENANKQEAGTSDDKISTNSRLWLGLKDPRIVRVPRAFGGKDRHSKVSTIRGLRDRRVRLSVQTAIQLYDLQDKLGVNQPSKAVDWLLAAAQHEIDKLPPLPFPPANFTQLCQSFPVSEEATLRPGAASSYHQTVEDPSYAAHRNVKCADESGDRLLALFSNSKTNDDGDEVIGNKVAELSKFPNFSLNSSVGRDATAEQAIGSDQGLGSSMIPYASYYHLEQANLNAYDQHQLGGNSSKVDAPNSFSMPSSLSLGPGSQLVLYASGATPVPSMFSPYMTSLNGLNISRQPSHAQPAVSQDLRSSSVTFLQSGSTPIMVRPASLQRFSTGYHNPYDTHEN